MPNRGVGAIELGLGIKANEKDVAGLAAGIMGICWPDFSATGERDYFPNDSKEFRDLYDGLVSFNAFGEIEADDQWGAAFQLTCEIREFRRDLDRLNEEVIR